VGRRGGSAGMLFHKIMANQYFEMWFSEACNIIVPVSVTHYALIDMLGWLFADSGIILRGFWRLGLKSFFHVRHENTLLLACLSNVSSFSHIFGSIHESPV